LSNKKEKKEILSFFKIEDATIDPLIGWLRLSFQDPYISGMVLQYKGLDGLWKCLLNRRMTSCFDFRNELFIVSF
jgi:hypothetical protein